ncbi:amino acid ABC transporter substrate-binding protein (PAAT family) [Blastococcus colisei]|uniref:Amino acid ABC transporter substrate-binding protein (PAAT family) n=1 Tax=Blastococcus colisei TaxID=1564162 RepID=A0A543PFB9_9ACTN|nr:transporter substrate-binding domain-containing protein [Blastococcus colisei]TQN42770.1 amino acid ABC transporter substrate-binding protein (PAAT family) [Blastococcus colisei]
MRTSRTFLTRLLPLALAAGLVAACGAQVEDPESAAAAAETSAACDDPDISGDPFAAPELLSLQADEALADQVPAVFRDEPLVIGVAPDLPPINFGKDGEQRGYEADLLRAAGQLAGVEVVFQQSQNALQEYGAGQVDGIAGAFTDTLERQELGDFIDYSTGSRAALTQQCNPEGIESTEDLCGLDVVAAVGTVQLAQLTDRTTPGSLLTLCEEAGLPAPIPVQADTSVSAITSLTAGRADALVTGEPIAINAVKQSDGALTIAYVEELPVPVGVMLSKDLSGLTEVLAQAYQQLVDDGTYAEIMNSYGIEYGLLDTITVNGATS